MAAGARRHTCQRTLRRVSICLCRKEAPLLEREQQTALRFLRGKSAWHSTPTSRSANRDLPYPDDYARSHQTRSRRLVEDREALEDDLKVHSHLRGKWRHQCGRDPPTRQKKEAAVP